MKKSFANLFFVATLTAFLPIAFAQSSTPISSTTLKIPKILPITYLGQVTDKKNLRLIEAIHKAVASGYTEIVLFIDSEGGLIDSTYLTYTTIKSLPINLKTVAANRVYSAAVALFCMGNERYASDTSLFMIHPVRSHIPMTIEDVWGRLEELKLVEQSQEKIYDSCFADKSWRSIYSDRKTTFFKSETAKKLGLVNKSEKLIFDPIVMERYSSLQIIGDDPRDIEDQR